MRFLVCESVFLRMGWWDNRVSYQHYIKQLTVLNKQNMYRQPTLSLEQNLSFYMIRTGSPSANTDQVGFIYMLNSKDSSWIPVRPQIILGLSRISQDFCIHICHYPKSNQSVNLLYVTVDQRSLLVQICHQLPSKYFFFPQIDIKYINITKKAFLMYLQES